MSKTARSRILGLVLVAVSVTLSAVGFVGNRQADDDADRVRARAVATPVEAWTLVAVADALDVPGTDVVLLDRCAVVKVRRVLAERDVLLVSADGKSMQVVKSCPA